MSGTTLPDPTTIVPYVDATGIHIPTFEQVLLYQKAVYQAIYGADIYLGNDSQDGQKVALEAQAYYDACVTAAVVFNSFSPQSASGTQLSTLVKINGLTRETPSNSQADVLIVGTPGTTITNGVLSDVYGNYWDLPASVIIPASTTITVTATAEKSGVINVAPGELNIIETPTRGWVSASNAQASTPGNPVEYDPALRTRQTQSTQLPSVSVRDGITAALLALPGVTRVVPFENDTPFTSTNGIPPFSTCFVVDGGSATDIASIIALKKTLGGPTYGTTSEVVNNTYGNPITIYFDRSTQVPITIRVALKALNGYTSGIGAQIQSAIVTYITSQVNIGQDVVLADIYLPANLFGAAASATYRILPNGITMSTGGTLLAADIPIAYNQEATTQTSLITVAPST